MPRMNILNKSELSFFKKPPEFTALQRKSCFSFSNKLIELTMQLHGINNQIGFLLSLGYFKITKRFYPPEDFNIRDIYYVSRLLNHSKQEFHPEKYTTRTRQNHQLKIIELFGFRKFDILYKQKIKIQIMVMVKGHLKPKIIFWRCIDIMISDKVSLPTYHRIQNLILHAISRYKSEMNSIIKLNITAECRKIFDSLLVQSPESNKYRLTLLKKPSQSTAPMKIKDRLADMQLIAKLYWHIEPILQQLNLTTEGIRYFSSGIIKINTHHFLRKQKTDIDLHIIAFTCNQYYRLQDNLVDVFLSSVKNTENTAQRKHKNWYYEHRNISSKMIIDKINKINLDILSRFEAIRLVIIDENLIEKEKLKNIENLVQSQDIDSITISKFDEIKDNLSGNSNCDDDVYYNILEAGSIQLQNRVSGILKLLNFRDDGNSTSLIDAIKNFIRKDGNINVNAPIEFLKSSERKALMKNDKFRTSLYKVFLFQHVAQAIRSGRLNLLHSHKYRSLDSYLISKEKWKSYKNELIEHSGMTRVIDPIVTLMGLDQKLLLQFQKSNKNILSGKNHYFKLAKDGTWCVNTPKIDEPYLELFTPLFPISPVVQLTEVLSTVNWQTNFISELQHWQQQYNRSKPVNLNIAALMGVGCAIGIHKLSRISNQIKEEELENIVNWHFSLKNLQAANNCILNYMNKMELPNIYRSSSSILHTASDGQKFEVTVDSLNANYSFKYFGKAQGVSAYSFIDERNLLWHSLVFSAAERESAYVIDGLIENDVVKSDIHSTDTHGYSEVIFAITYLLGLSFAPRIRNLKKQVLYIFKSKSSKLSNDYNSWAIKPSKTIDEAIICEYWDEILRLVATIKLKENTASDIFRRLNSYSKQHKLYTALKAFGRIIKSLFVTKYIDEVKLRQTIEKQLNKIEFANRFTRAVAVGNPRNFSMGEKEEQEIAHSCNRLIKNAIICWNYMYLEKQLDQATCLDKEKIIEAIKAHSPMSWAHINLLGEYDFSEEKMKDSFGILATKNIL